MARYRVRVQDWSRQRTLTFLRVVVLMLTGHKHALQNALNRFFRTLGLLREVPTANAYSQARQKVEPALFQHLNQLVVEKFYTLYEEEGGVKRWQGRRVLGIGQILALVLLYEIQDIRRFPRVQDCVSYCRLVKCAKESSGKKVGTAGKKIGNVHLRWAVAEAAVLFLRQSQPGKVSFAKLEHKYGKAKALTVLAHKLGRAVSYLLTRDQVFDLNRFVSA